MSNAETQIKNLWERHLETEFAMKSPEEALATMTDDPRVTIVPILIGGRGREEIRHFYGHHFLNQIPPDLEVLPISAENLYWDNATILRQAGLLPDSGLPVRGAESARQILDPCAPHNKLIPPA